MRFSLFLFVLVIAPSARAESQSAIVRSVPSDAAPVSSVAPDERPAPTGILTFTDALALAMVNHPDLLSFPFELRVAEARILQAGLRPNPELEIELEEFGGSGDRSGFDSAETTFRIGQAIELGGKRARRTSLATIEKDLVRWDYESARLDVVCEVTRGFAAVLAAEERLALAERMLELSRQARSAAAQRVQAGKDSPVDELRASVVFSESRIEQRKAEQALIAARHALAATWGDSEPAFDAVAGNLYDVEPPVPPDDPAVAIANNPDVGRWEIQQEQRRAALRLEKARAAPDLTLSGGVQRFEEADQSALVFGLSIPIPLFDRNQGGIEEATVRLAQARRQHEAVRVKTRAALAEAIAALGAAYDEAAILRDDVLPKAQQAFEAATKGYLEGKFDYLYTLDAQRGLLEAQARYIDSVEAYHKARADVERLIGGALHPADADRSPASVNEPLSQEYSYEK
ncbi:MAG: TolC family protein [Phycisphaerae bacterium]|nr:TolC family protein [Phycisphaerae bacterium]